jgi:hypothetical protein
MTFPKSFQATPYPAPDKFNTVVLTTTQSWTPPAGITSAEITVVDGGYGSPVGDTSFSGKASIKVIALNPAVTYTATIGAGGAGGASTPGGASSFSGAGLTTLTSTNGTINYSQRFSGVTTVASYTVFGDFGKSGLNGTAGSPGAIIIRY